jgi:hypothetical protein
MRPEADGSVYRTVYQRGDYQPNGSQLEPLRLVLTSQIGGLAQIMSPLL